MLFFQIWNKIVAIHHLLFITFSQHAADADKEKMKRIVVYFAPDSQIPRLLSAAWISLLKSADFPWTEDIPEIELDCEDTSLSFSFLTNRKTTIASEMDASIDRPQSVDMLTTCSPEFKEKLQVEDVKALTTHATPTALPSPYITLTRQTVPASTLDQKGTNDTFNSSNRKRAGFSIDELLRPDSTIVNFLKKKTIDLENSFFSPHNQLHQQYRLSFLQLLWRAQCLQQCRSQVFHTLLLWETLLQSIHLLRH